MQFTAKRPQLSSNSDESPNIHHSDIDIAKGIGILSVVAGHIYTGSIVPAIFLWHMPLFFFISGSLFSPRQNLLRYAISKSKSLLIPYTSFLLLLSLPFLLKAAFTAPAGIGSLVLNMLYGGSRLTSWFGVFWFVTCLFSTQQLANLLITRVPRITVPLCLGALCVAFSLAWWFPETESPWNLHVMFMALPIFMLGHLIRTGFMRDYTSWIALLAPIALVAAGAGILGAFDMKRGWYGTPFVSLIAAVAVIFFVLNVAKLVTRYNMLSRFLMFLGKASMTIMFTHQATQLSMMAVGFNSATLRLIAALMVGLVAHVLLTKTEFTRRFFLGHFERAPSSRLASV